MQKMTTEPVRIISEIAAGVTALVAATIALLLGFDVIDWSSEQVTLVMGVLAAVGALIVGAVTRGKVWSPTGMDNQVEETVSNAMTEFAFEEGFDKLADAELAEADAEIAEAELEGDDS